MARLQNAAIASPMRHAQWRAALGAKQEEWDGEAQEKTWLLLSLVRGKSERRHAAITKPGPDIRRSASAPATAAPTLRTQNHVRLLALVPLRNSSVCRGW